MGQCLDHLLQQYAGRIATRRVVTAPALVSQLPSLLGEAFGGKTPILLVADPNTWAAAGAGVADALGAAGLALEMLILAPHPGEKRIHPHQARVDQVAAHLRKDPTRLPLAVGAGTINDIVKVAAFVEGRPYAVVATAPSMNGWTSAIAAIIVDGLKTTQAVRGPVLVAADLDVLRRAPVEMVGAGFADMMAKWVASGDWRLADRLLGSGFDPRLEEISKAAIDLLEGREEAIAARQPQAVERLMEALCISGLSMAVAESSAHISGAEHLFSHYIDMMMADVAERELHGRQVGIGTLCSASMYDALLRWSPDRFDVEACVAGQPSWEQRREQVERHFGPLTSVVIEEVRELRGDSQALRARLERFVSLWPDLRGEVAAAVASRGVIDRRLRRCGAPTHYCDLGLTREQVRDILTWSGDIRSRYTILHLAADLGCLDQWIEAALADFEQVSQAATDPTC